MTPIFGWAELTEVARIDHAEAFQQKTKAITPESYNLKVGAITTDLSTSWGVEYNDNIAQTPTNPEDETIVKAHLKSKTLWPITEKNTLNFDLDLGYRWYVTHNDLSSHRNFLEVNPGSELAFKVWIKNFEFKLYDQIHYLTDAADARVYNVETGSVDTNLIDFGRIENRAGIQSMADFNDLKVFFGYSRDDIKADKAEFKSYNRLRHTVYVTPILRITPEFSLGWINSYSINDYTMKVQNDSRSFMTGPTMNWMLSQNSSVAWDIYWKRALFDSDGINGDNSDYSGMNTELKITQAINEFLSHRLTLYRLTDVGTVSNTTTRTGVSYEPSWWVRENLALRGRVAFEKGKDSGTSSYQEEFIRRVFGAGFSYTLSPKMTLDTFYNYTRQTSDIDSRNYDQNSVTMTFNYDF